MRQFFQSSIAVVSFLLVTTIATASYADNASQKADIEKFYKPVAQKDLVVFLPPHENTANGSSSGGNATFSGSGGCPNQINIGSVPSTTTVTGNTDINVNIQGSVVVQCGMF